MTYRLPVALVFAACASVCVAQSGANSSTNTSSSAAGAAGAANVPDAAKAAKSLKALRAAKAARLAKSAEAARLAEAAEQANVAQVAKAAKEADEAKAAKAAEAAEAAKVADALKAAEAEKAAEVAQAQAAGQVRAAQAAEAVRAAIPRLQFIDMGGFDQTLSTSLNTASPKVEVGFYDKVTPSALPERLQKWMAAVESRGGKVKITPPPSSVAPKNPFLLISAISSIWSASGMVRDASAESRFAVAGNYDAELVLKQDDKGDTLVEKLVFVQRTK